MDKNAILNRLHSLTGSLKPASGSRPDDLQLLQRSLLEQLTVNPDLAVSGNRTRQEFAQPAASAAPEMTMRSFAGFASVVDGWNGGWIGFSFRIRPMVEIPRWRPARVRTSDSFFFPSVGHKV
jgi:hypothetical protein